jgi:hypothetical protein
MMIPFSSLNFFWFVSRSVELRPGNGWERRKEERGRRRGRRRGDAGEKINLPSRMTPDGRREERKSGRRNMEGGSRKSEFFPKMTPTGMVTQNIISFGRQQVAYGIYLKKN